MMVPWQRFLKRSIDLCLAVFGLIALSWLIIICWFIAAIDTRQNGFFIQQRVGMGGRLFHLIKIRTMRPVQGVTTVVTSRNDPRITRIGAWLRRLKLDELPQLVNVILGHMSLVGPRPDVAEFADLLQGKDRIILSIRPGITGPATLAFRNEEELLANSENPEQYNRWVIFPAKVRINRLYVETYSIRKDIMYILATVIPCLGGRIVHLFEPDKETRESAYTHEGS